MKNLINKIKLDKIIKLGTYLSLSLIFLHLIIIAGFYVILPPYIPLYNQMSWGNDQIASKMEIFIPIFITSVFFIMNLFIGLKIYEKMPLLSRILSITALLLCILSIIFIIRIISLAL